MIAAFLTACFFAFSAFCGGRSGRLAGAMNAALWRTMFAFVALTLIVMVMGGGFEGPGLWIFVLSGVIGFGLGDLCLFQAYVRIGSRRSMVLCQCLAAPVAALTEWLLLGTVLRWMEWLVIGMILSGVAMALRPSKSLPVPPRILKQGIFFGIGATLGQAWGAVLSRLAFHQNAMAGFDVPATSVTFQRMLGGIGLVLLFYWLSKSALREGHPIAALKKGRYWLLLNGLAGPVVGVSLFQLAQESTPSGLVLAVVAITPLLLIPAAWKYEGDRPTWLSLIGALLAVGGVAMLVLG